MSIKDRKSPFAIAAGAALATSMAMSFNAQASENPFQLNELSSGYQLADAHAAKDGEGKCGEGKCGEDKDKEGKCGEGKCGEDKAADKKDGEGKCGEGKCGENK